MAKIKNKNLENLEVAKNLETLELRKEVADYEEFIQAQKLEIYVNEEKVVKAANKIWAAYVGRPNKRGRSFQSDHFMPMMTFNTEPMNAQK